MANAGREKISAAVDYNAENKTSRNSYQNKQMITQEMAKLFLQKTSDQ